MFCLFSSVCLYHHTHLCLSLFPLCVLRFGCPPPPSPRRRVEKQEHINVCKLMHQLLSCLTPSLPQHVNFRAERCTHAPVNSTFSGSITHLLSMLCILMKIPSHTGAKKKTKRLRGFQTCYFYRSFPSDIMAVKGLMSGPVLVKLPFFTHIRASGFVCRIKSFCLTERS